MSTAWAKKANTAPVAVVRHRMLQLHPYHGAVGAEIALVERHCLVRAGQQTGHGGGLHHQDPRCQSGLVRALKDIPRGSRAWLRPTRRANPVHAVEAAIDVGDDHPAARPNTSMSAGMLAVVLLRASPGLATGGLAVEPWPPAGKRRRTALAFASCTEPVSPHTQGGVKDKGPASAGAPLSASLLALVPPPLGHDHQRGEPVR